MQSSRRWEMSGSSKTWKFTAGSAAALIVFVAVVGIVQTRSPASVLASPRSRAVTGPHVAARTPVAPVSHAAPAREYAASSSATGMSASLAPPLGWR
jgi:hypothetical protein